MQKKYKHLELEWLWLFFFNFQHQKEESFGENSAAISFWENWKRFHENFNYSLQFWAWHLLQALNPDIESAFPRLFSFLQNKTLLQLLESEVFLVFELT